MLHAQATKIATSSIPEAEVVVGENGTRVSFEEWDVPSNSEDNSTVIVAVASLNTFASEGVVVLVEGAVSR